MRPLTIAALALAALLAPSSPARAATVEPRVPVAVRERPSSSARVVDRVPAGGKLQLLGRTSDGSWTHVETDNGDGWVPSAQLKGNVKGQKATEEEAAEEEDPAKPLAKRRNVRPEAWVSKSRYRDGDDNKLVVSALKAELYGRPSAGGSVLGVLRRGESVTLVRKSSDKKWLLVDIGGGDSAWLEAQAVKPGKAKSTTATVEEQEEKDAEPSPAAKKGKKLVKVESPPEQKADDAAQTRKRDEALDAEQAPLQGEGSTGADPAASAEAEGSPPESKKKKGKKGVKVASRGDADAGAGEEVTITRPQAPPHGPNYFGVGARIGFAVMDTRFTSNAAAPPAGTSDIFNYASSSTGVAVMVGAGYTRAVGRRFRFGVDASYLFAGATGIRLKVANAPITLAQQMHMVDFGLSPGVHFDVIGGLDFRLRLGGELQLNLIQGNNQAKLPSDQILGFTFGIGIDAPALFGIPLGVHLYGGGLFGDRAQTPGLQEGVASQTFGAAFGVYLGYRVYKGLAVEVGYSYNLVLTDLRGPAARDRNATITAASRGNANSVVLLGFSYNR